MPVNLIILEGCCGLNGSDTHLFLCNIGDKRFFYSLVVRPKPSHNNGSQWKSCGHPLPGHPRNVLNMTCGHPSHDSLATLFVSCGHPLQVRKRPHGDMLRIFYGHVPGPFFLVLAIMSATFAAALCDRCNRHSTHASKTYTWCAHARVANRPKFSGTVPTFQ